MNRERLVGDLSQMFQQGQIALQTINGINFEEFQANILRDYAARHALTIIGEISSRIQRHSPDFINENPQFEWSKMVSMRNFVVHAYDRVDIKIVWDTIANDIPKLLKYIDDSNFLP
jgi:uncharacterized protein with HEPN domain